MKNTMQAQTADQGTASSSPKSFIFYQDWELALNKLPESMRLEAYQSLVAYAFRGDTPQDPIIDAVLTTMIGTLQRDKTKYNQKVERMARNRRARKPTCPTPEQPDEQQCTQRPYAEAKAPVPCTGRAEQRGAEPLGAGPHGAGPLGSAEQHGAEFQTEVQTCTQRPDAEAKAPAPCAPAPCAPAPCAPAPCAPAAEALVQMSEGEQRDLRLRSDFEAFRQAYPGTKCGLDTEFSNLKNRYGERWREIVPLLMPGLERENNYREHLKKSYNFVPNRSTLTSWINQARWEAEYPRPQVAAENTQDKQHASQAPRPETQYEKEKRERREHDAMMANYRMRFSQRVPGAYTPNAIIGFHTYLMDRCDDMSDEELARYLAAIKGE